MASRRLMTRRVNILQVPGRNDEAWRHEIAEACYASGWRYYEHWGDGALDVEPNVDCVVVAWSRPAQSDPEAVWIVHTCAPEDALQALIDRFGATVDNAAIHASNRYLFATQLAQAGAPVSSLYDAELNVPGLGRIANPDPIDTPADTGGPLALYRCIPPAQRPLAWSAELLDVSESAEVARSEEGVVIGLAGRRRILTQGPHISLPNGPWTVTFNITVDAPGPTVLRFEWGDADIEQTLHARGVYEVSLTGVLDESVLANLKTLLIVPKLEGSLTFGSLALVPVQRT